MIRMLDRQKKTIDVLENKLEQIIKNITLILDESFMMEIFNIFEIYLPPFKEFLDYMYENKKQQ